MSVLRPTQQCPCWAGGQPDPILEVVRALSAELEGELWLETVHHPLDVQTAFELQPALDVLGSTRTHVRREAGYEPAGTIVEAARHLEVMLVAMSTQAGTVALRRRGTFRAAARRRMGDLSSVE